MAGRNEVAKATIYLDRKQAESALAGLKRQAEELRKEIYDYQEFLVLIFVFFMLESQILFGNILMKTSPQSRFNFFNYSRASSNCRNNQFR